MMPAAEASHSLKQAIDLVVWRPLCSLLHDFNTSFELPDCYFGKKQLEMVVIRDRDFRQTTGLFLHQFQVNILYLHPI